MRETFEGAPCIRWIHGLFGDCVYGWQEALSLSLGYLSILCWLNAQMPQVIKNYRLQDAESLSFTFLSVWLLGDFANFIGCILTGQMDFQVYLSIYFIGIDTLLCIQWLYYVKYPNNRLRRLLNPTLYSAADKKLATENDDEQTQLLGGGDDSREQQQGGYGAVRTLLTVGFFFTLASNQPQVLTTTTTSHDNPVVLSFLDDDIARNLWIGRFFAWLCTTLYLSSRVPQIARNFRRRSVQGLAMALFFFAAAGNLTYTLSIFLNPRQTRQSLLEAVPYIIGSAGTLMFDTTIFIQYLLYNQNTQEKNKLTTEEP